MASKNKGTFFTSSLLKWFEQNHRPLPWKGIKNPYFIWLSEIILQQTRVEQGLPYYNHFTKTYPTVHDLANATEDEVMKSWEGLGYYSRARNLHAAAKQISIEFNGQFPNTYEKIKSLKGVGPYTAAAIASFAFKLPYAVVDGNVYRVLSRYYGLDTPIDSTKGKKEFSELAETLLNKDKPGIYNQAIMDFGATWCTPKNPNCGKCPMESNCSAYKNDRVSKLPVKAKKIKKRARFFNYFILNTGACIILQKRTQKDIWQNLYEFPMLESPQLLDQNELELLGIQKNILPQGAELIKYSKPFQQTLSHQKINARFWEYRIDSTSLQEKSELVFVKRNKLGKFAFPKIIDWYLADNSLYLELF